MLKKIKSGNYIKYNNQLYIIETVKPGGWLIRDVYTTLHSLPLTFKWLEHNPEKWKLANIDEHPEYFL